MSGINKCIFCGNATREPDLKIARTGTRYVTFGIAVNNRVFDQSDQQFKDSVSYVDFIAFGDNVDYIMEHVHRGTRVYVESVLEQSMYRDKKDNKIKRWTSFRVTSIDAREGDKPAWTSPEWI